MAQSNISTLDTNMFPAGTYVVLLNTCSEDPNVWKLSMSVGFCYLLRSASDTFTFHIAQDNKGGNSNGWSIGSHSDNRPNKLKLRAASDQEIAEYKRLGKPYDTTLLKHELQIINNYQIF